MKVLESLPSSNDEYWEHSDTRNVDVSKLIDMTRTCKHEWSIDFGKRDAQCGKCGYGFNFVPNEVTYKGGKLYSKEGRVLTD